MKLKTIAIAVAAMMLSANVAFAGGNYIVNTNSANLLLRSGAGTNYAIKARMPKGAQVYVNYINGAWANVTYNGMTGFASAQYLKLVQPVTPVVSGYKWVLNGSQPFRVTTVYKYSDGSKHSSRYYSKGKNTKNTAGSYAYGIDIASPYGTNVFAPANGVVRNIQWQPNGFGNVFEIAQDDGVVSLFAHLSKVVVSNGQRVVAGQRIGEVGSTGNSSGNHLHFEFSNMNPYDYYKGKVQFNVVAKRGLEK